jgi:hypothetical protein
MPRSNPNPPPLPRPEPGNTVAGTHGMHSESLVNLRAEELRPRIIEAAPWTADPGFAGTLELYTRALATALMGSEFIAQVAAEKGYGKIAPCTIETVNASRNTAARLGTLLGLDPRSKAVIQSLAASTEISLAGLEQLAEHGHAIRERRPAKLAERSDASGSGQEPDQQSDRKPRDKYQSEPKRQPDS